MLIEVWIKDSAALLSEIDESMAKELLREQLGIYFLSDEYSVDGYDER